MICTLDKFNDPFYWTAKAIQEGKDIVIHQGGTSSSKTWSNLQYIIINSLKHDNELTSIVSETMPHLKRGAMRDFFTIINNAGMYKAENHNKTDNTYKVGNSLVEFFSADSPDKVRGPRRNNLFINECNNISYETYDQLHTRTKGWEILDFNPVSEFWVHNDVLNNDKLNTAFFKSTYKNNKFLDKKIIDSIEAKKDNPKYSNWWRIYGMGEIGIFEGLIFPIFHQIEELPISDSYFYGLDFGYSVDPTSLIKMCKIGNKLYCDELIYETQLLNSDIIKRFTKFAVNKSELIVADSAEPKSIDEIYRAGYNVKPAIKGADSVVYGLNHLNELEIYVTKRSINLIKELRNYAWDKDKTGKQLNKPIDLFNHAIDAIRYAANFMNKKSDKFYFK